MSKKLVIRINNLQEKEELDNNSDRFTVTTIHWDRIIGVILASLLVIALVIWLTISLFSDDPDSSDKLSNPLSTTIQDPVPDVFKSATPEDMGVADVEPPRLAADEEIFLEPQSSEESAPESTIVDQQGELAIDDGSHPDTEIVASAEQLVSEVLLSVVAEDVPQVINEESLEPPAEEASSPFAEETGAEELVVELASKEERGEREETIDTEVIPTDRPEAAGVETVGSAPQAPPERMLAEEAEINVANAESIINPVRSSGPAAPVIVHSDQITNAQLTSWVERSEPRDELGSVVYLEEDQLLRIFLFTEMADLSGRILYHDWYLGEKNMARVRIPVTTDSVAASSSKFIDRYMLGNWKVLVTDDTGKLMISASFEVRPG